MANLFIRRPVNEQSEHGLKRVLGPVALTMLGIGAIIGTGIFVLTGTAAAGSEGHLGAGPAIVISFVITGVACGLAALCYAEFASMVPLAALNNPKPVAAALEFFGEDNVATIISLGAVLSITSVLVVMQMAQTRIFYVMSRDGLLPKVLSRIDPRFGTPMICTLLTGILVAIPAGLIDIGAAAELTNIGTLFAFVLVAGGIMVLRVKEPAAERKFKIPFVWLVSPGCILICVYLMVSLPLTTWIRFVGWMAIGLLIYFAYSVRHSVLQNKLA